MKTEREHPIWASIRKEIAPPPCAQLLGWDVLEAAPGSGRVRIAFNGKAEFANPMGNIQGGFLAAMLDDAMGPALATTFEPDEFGPTIELKVNFLKPARPGPLVADAWIVQRGKSIAFLAGELRDQGGTLLATSTATAKLIKGAF